MSGLFVVYQRDCRIRGKIAASAGGYCIAGGDNSP
jgi:hypothetical protein